MLEVITGCMFSGKTSELIRRLRRYRIAGERVLVFKPTLDVRYAKDQLSTHYQDTFPAIRVASVDDLKRHMEGAFSLFGGVLGVDEVQFMDPEIVPFLEHWANRGRRVIVAGLDLDYRGEPFGPMPQLLALADRITKLTAVCVAPDSTGDPCGKPATRSFRIPEKDAGDVIQVGAAGVYEARCRTCWAKGMKEAL